ncbi:MAG: TetR/AcrR family transcriptional regulator [Archangium sp.]|nr:TetR/AcrR family transcriptional regulator [Archangium sp.]
MPRPNYENIAQDKKTRLLEAAMKEFAAHGYQLASINRILESAGFSKSSFYHYFDDKLDLAATVFIVCAEPETKLLELALPETADAFWAELRRSSIERLEKLETKRLEYDCLIRLGNAMLSEPDLAARVMPMFIPGRQKMMAFFQRGVELGALRTDLPLTTQMALIEAAKTAAYKSTFPGDTVPTDPDMESFSDLVIDLARRICSP